MKRETEKSETIVRSPFNQLNVQRRRERFTGYFCATCSRVCARATCSRGETTTHQITWIFNCWRRSVVCVLLSHFSTFSWHIQRVCEWRAREETLAKRWMRKLQRRYEDETRREDDCHLVHFERSNKSVQENVQISWVCICMNGETLNIYTAGREGERNIEQTVSCECSMVMVFFNTLTISHQCNEYSQVRCRRQWQYCSNRTSVPMRALFNAIHHNSLSQWLTRAHVYLRFHFISCACRRAYII